jgi:hypothetical protein
MARGTGDALPGDEGGTTMAQGVGGNAEGARAAHETTVGLHVAWLVALARASRLEDDRALRLDVDIRTAQAQLIRALLLACADGIPLKDLHARFINPVGREARVYAATTALLADTVRHVERQLASA